VQIRESQITKTAGKLPNVILLQFECSFTGESLERRGAGIQYIGRCIEY